MQIIRLYNEKGEHLLSVLPCCEDEGEWDIADPDGKVLWHGVDKDFVVMLGEKMGWEYL